MRVVSVACKQSTIDQSRSSQRGYYRTKDITPKKKLSWVRVSVKTHIVPKLSETEKRCQDEYCLLRQGDCRRKPNPDGPVLNSSPGEDNFVLSMIDARPQEGKP